VEIRAAYIAAAGLSAGKAVAANIERNLSVLFKLAYLG
jgi:hypothetical protein